MDRILEDESKGTGAARYENTKADETGKRVMSLSDASEEIDNLDLAAFLEKVLDSNWSSRSDQLSRFYQYLEKAFSQVSFPWKIFKEPSVSTLIDVPLSHIPTSVYKTSVDWINRLTPESLLGFQLWGLDQIVTEWAAQQGDAKGAQDTCSKAKVPLFVALAMVLRSKPDTMINSLRTLRVRPKYQGQDKLPLIIWMMAQASQGDLSAGLYSWAHNLLPLAGNFESCSPHSMDLILQFVEIILSNPEARTILVYGDVREGERLIPPSSFEILVRLTFPASYDRVEATKRFEAVYPLLKEVALAPGGNAVKQIFTFSFKLAGKEGNPGLAQEAASIAIRCVTENADCFNHWDIQHLEACVALLRKLVPKLSSSPRDTLSVNRTMNSFRLKNEKAITGEGSNCSLYKEADKYCKLISRRLSPGRDGHRLHQKRGKMVASDVGVESKAEETEKPIASLSEAAGGKIVRKQILAKGVFRERMGDSEETEQPIASAKMDPPHSEDEVSDDPGWIVVSRNRRSRMADRGAKGGVSGKILPKQSLAKGVFRERMVDSEEREQPIASLSEAAAKIHQSELAAFLNPDRVLPGFDFWRFYHFLETAFSGVSLQWLKMLKETPLSKLIDVPLSYIPKSVYKTLSDWIKELQTESHSNFITWMLDCILEDWAAQKGDAQETSSNSHVAGIVVGLAMVLRSKPDALTPVLPMLRWRPRYQGQDKLPLIVWMLALASQGDLSAGLYSWAHVLLPLVGNYECCTPHSMDLILQFVEIILSNPEARTILVSGAVREGERLIPPSSFEILVRLTFPASSARVEATKRFEAVYPLLKEVALAPGGNAVKQIFTFSLKLAGEGNPGLAKEAAAIAVWSLTENVDCFKHWAILYKEHLEASVALLRKLVDEWKDHSPKLSSSPRDTLTVNRTMKCFREQNEKAIT